MFVNIPENFSTMCKPVVYEYTSDEQGDIVIEIINERTSEQLVVKKFYSSTSAKVNIAPLIFDTMLPHPSTVTLAEDWDACYKYPRITVKVGSETTAKRYLTYSKREIEAPQLITTMPPNRLLHSCDFDSLTVVVPDGAQASFSLSGLPREGGDEVDISTTNCGYNTLLHPFLIDASLYACSYSTLRVKFYTDTELQREINYSLSPDKCSGYRVAWISSYGAIEHYTFPIVVDQGYLNSGATVKTLRSAYGSATEIEALSEILSSPKVWRYSDGEYTEIELLTTEQEIRRDGALMIATLKIKENG
ncbi:MAG: hypothetical protein R3Y44_01420 [Rikenellaceae bacterium]